mmetsp:Transcript_21734/g.19255  ORF Transcript_21734/g.19255 Transcript_21734/m.19255 type:complete len:137 (-) Transcript_21734:19-429(-)
MESILSTKMIISDGDASPLMNHFQKIFKSRSPDHQLVKSRINLEETEFSLDKRKLRRMSKSRNSLIQRFSKNKISEKSKETEIISTIDFIKNETFLMNKNIKQKTKLNFSTFNQRGVNATKKWKRNKRNKLNLNYL